MKFNTIQDEMDYEAIIQRAAKDKTGVPEHECKIEGGCEVDKDYQDSVESWSKANNDVCPECGGHGLMGHVGGCVKTE